MPPGKCTTLEREGTSPPGDGSPRAPLHASTERMEVSVVRTAVLDQAAVNRLVSLLAKLVAIRHLNNEA